MKKYFILFLVLFFSYPSLSQTLQIEGSYTYIWDVNSLDKELRYSESTINSNVSVGINQHSIGFQLFKIYTSGSAFSYNLIEDKNDYTLIGMYYQYDLVKSKKYSFFPEFSINYGNYCTCGNSDPVKLANILYVGFGLGLDIEIYKNLLLLTGFHSYQPILNDQVTFGFTQYILGVGFRFGE